MSRKILLIFLFLVVIGALVLSIVFIKISRHASQTISRLQKERGPVKVAVREIPLSQKKGWELFADLGEVRDIAFFESQYYLATPGAVMVSEEGGRIIRTLNTIWGLPENSYRQLLKGEEGVYALTDGGVLVQLRKDNALVYDGASTGKIFSIAGTEAELYIAADRGVFVLRGDELSIAEDIERVNIAKPFRSGIVAGTTYGTVYRFMPGAKDSIAELDAVNDLWEREDMLYIATPLGLVTVAEEGRRERFRGEFLTTIAELNGELFFGTFDGRIIVGDRSERITRKNGHINRLRLLGDRLFACTSEGVYALEGQKWRVFYKPRQEVPLTYITTLLPTGSGLLIGTFEDGCLSLKGDRIQRIPLGDEVNEINHLAQQAQSVLVATNSGLFEMSDKGMRKYEGLPSLFVHSISAQGKRIIAGTSSGFCVIDLSDLSVRNYGAFHGLISNRVYAVAATSREIVLGTLGGISIFDGRAFRNVTSANSDLKSNWVNGLQDAGERVYVGTYGGGIGYFGQKGFSSIEETDGTEVNLNGLFYRKPFLFAGTCKSGLMVYNEKSGRIVFFKGIFPLDNVTAVSADDRYYFIGTTQGVYRIDAKELSFI